MDRFKQLQQLLADEPADSFLNYALALEYAKNNELQQAITIIEQVLHRDPNYLGAYLQLGGLYEQTLHFDKAAELYKKGIDVAQKQRNTKAKGELCTALDLLADN